MARARRRTASCSAPPRCATPSWCASAARRFPGRVAVGIDARDGRVAVSGWLETSETDVLTLARRFEDAGVAALIHTDIARDGTGDGPEPRRERGAGARGVDSRDRVRRRRLARRRAPGRCGRGLAGLIVGTALYTGAVDLARALEIAACS